MENPNKIMTQPQWMLNPALIKCMDILNEGCETNTMNAYLVGGCVRNWLMHKAVSDVDIATCLTPDSVITRYENAGVKVVPTGYDHGTVTAVIDVETFEITTFRKDVNTDGRHADVTYTNDMHQDAARRDFTMNALYADLNGNIYDPLGQGIADCEAGIVKFIGNANDRIHEDVLRILRFFRFHGVYGEGKPNDEAIKACRDNAHLISNLSRERISQELSKITRMERAYYTFMLMQNSDVLSHLFDGDLNLDGLKKLHCFDYQPCWVMRVYIILGCDAEKFKASESCLVYSNKDKKHIKDVARVRAELTDINEKSIKMVAYYCGKKAVYDALVSIFTEGKASLKEIKALINIVEGWAIPTFKVTGGDLIAEGYEPGEMLGAELRRREEMWLKEVI